VHSDEENQFIWNSVCCPDVNPCSNICWIGLKYLNQDSNWQWVDESDLTYNNLMPSWHDNAGKNAVCMSSHEGGRWNRVYTNASCYAVCESVVTTTPKLELSWVRNIILIVFGSCCFVFILYLCYWKIKKNTKKKAKEFLLNQMSTMMLTTEEKTSSLEMVYDAPCRFLLDEWKIGELLNSGSFSHTYLMMPRKTLWNRKTFHLKGKIVVGKFIRVSSITSASSFVQEAKLLYNASEKSKNVVNIIGIVLKPPVLIMKYYRQGSLDDALLDDFNRSGGGDESEFPVVRRIKFIYQLCLAVSDLHKISIAHRDIASRNLLLSDDRERILLAGFGLARKVSIHNPYENVTVTKVIPRTSPPEAWLQAPANFSLKTDIWGVGLTMFEIINMRGITSRYTELKSVAGTEAMIPQKLLMEDLKLGKSFNRQRELWILMTQCWNAKPEMRPQIWEVEDRVKNFLTYPLGDHDRSYVDWDESDDFLDGHAGYGNFDSEAEESKFQPYQITDFSSSNTET